MDLTVNLIKYICNPALISIGARKIETVDDTSNEAEFCKDLYEQVRNTELTERVWNCTKKRVLITRDGTNPTDGWAYRYLIPDDCLYIIGIKGGHSYEEVEGFIHTNASDISTQISLLYVQAADVDTEADIDSELSRFKFNLKNVLAKRMASELCQVLTKTDEEQDKAHNRFKEAVQTSLAAGAFEVWNKHERKSNVVMTESLIQLIFNPALINIGANTIRGITDTSNEADLCKALYENIRDTELRERIWNCTKARVSLNVDITAPNNKWSYRYQLPDDCLYLIELEYDADYTVESGFILTNEKNSEDQINISYVQKTDVSDAAELDSELLRFDSSLRQVLSARLSASLSPQLSEQPADKAWLLYDYMLDKAFIANAYEDRHSIENGKESESSWITSRRG